ncbi:MAG: hypothetical protein R3F20_09330 [Planctomycetota bacterium]
MRMGLTALLLVTLSAAAAAQQAQQNTFTSALNVNDTALNAVFNQAVDPPPLQRSLLTDSPLIVNARATAGTPMLLLFAGATSANTAPINAATISNVQFDLLDTGPVGYADQALVNGYESPWNTSYFDGGGNWTMTTLMPSCMFVSGVQTCITAATFNVSLQAVVATPSNPPFNIDTTGAVQGNFCNGYKEFNFSGAADDEFGFYQFKPGMTFSFYGTSYTGCWVSENGLIKFGSSTSLGNFADPTVTLVNSYGPIIMSFFNDLDPDSSTGEKIYCQQYEENGVTKVRVVHEQIQEFGAATGGHGGTITLTENNEIAVFVASYNAFPSINTAVGISKGGVAAGSANFPTAFGRDLYNGATMTLNTGPLGANVPGFEVFNHGQNPTSNPMDIIGLFQFNGSGVGPGIVYVPDPALPANNGYIIQ